MKKNKYIKEIADRLPVVLDQTISGYYEDYNEQGELVKFPNIVAHPINHERRIRNAYKNHGMPGVLEYLTWINKLQLQKNVPAQSGADVAQEVVEKRPIRNLNNAH